MKSNNNLFGRKDKNGKDICDGDIFKVGKTVTKFIEYSGKRKAFCMVNVEALFRKGYADVYQPIVDEWWEQFNKEIEVIGNIKKNPELLDPFRGDNC